MNETKREDGFYWVCFSGDWEIGKYTSDGDLWTLSDSNVRWFDFEFTEIDEHKITRP